ncbi:WD40 repeat-containing protein [Tieghemostelium lacteum]|uniref:WD40 repeat-containing protein n=1 Tax=Tieghemostelium lacteum TaxID=361077 RepID=A0A152A8Z1_TIELA|nr:WD40 repeat-containing protein [Tieghemostelium lacteum]|eukprot:KYR02684.1 WD40 repeat-containing protein [Tieghemostelium lacteum]
MKLHETKLVGHKDSILCVATHSTKEIIATSSEDSTARIWDTKTNKTIQCIQPFKDTAITNITFDSDNFVYCSHNNTISVFDLRQPSIIIRNISHQYTYNKEEINQITFDSRYQYLAACDDSGQIKVIDVEKKKLQETLEKKHSNICSSVAFRHGVKNELLSGAMDCFLVRWNFIKGRPIFAETFNPLAKPKKPQPGQPLEQKQILNPPFVNSIDVSSDGKYVSVAIGNGELTCLDISTFQPYVKIETAHLSNISLVHYPKFEKPSNSNSIFSVGGHDKSIKLWDISPEMNQAYQNESIFKKADEEIDNSKRIKLYTQHHSKLNWITTSTFNHSLYIADTSNDLTVLSIVDG